MTAVELLKFPITSPGSVPLPQRFSRSDSQYLRILTAYSDTSPLQGLKDAGYQPKDIIAVIGKTEGT